MSESLLSGLPVADDLRGYSTVGQRSQRLDAYDKVTGRAIFTGDVSVPRMLHAALVTSTYPHGRLRGIDSSALEGLPGVVAVVGADELAATGCVAPSFGPVVRDREPFPSDVVRFAGEPVAVVVAKTREQAISAAKLVDVDVEALPAAVDIDSALEPGAPLVHSSLREGSEGIYTAPAPLSYGRSNALMTAELVEGDIEDALRRAVQRVSVRMTFPAVYQYAMEPFCVLADANRETITVYSTAQHPSQVQADLARMWGRPLSAVRVIGSYIGGGFGSKSFTHVEPIAVAASIFVGSPVRLELGISESMAVSRRHNMTGTATAAIDDSGAITGIDADLLFDGGAYALMGPIVAGNAASRMIGGYAFQNYRVRSTLVYTNTSPAGSFRAIGGVQGNWAMESLLAGIARELKVPLDDLRLRHVARRGQRVRRGRSPIDAEIRDSLSRVAAMSGVADDGAGRIGPGRLRGKGISLGVSDPGASPVSTAIVRLLADGSLVVSVGTSEMGQGSRTVLAMVAAESLGVALTSVTVMAADTASGPYDASTGASRSSVMSGLAVQRACDSIRRRILTHVTAEYGVGSGFADIVDGEVILPGRAPIALGAVVREVFGAPGGNLIGVGEVTRADFPSRPAFYEIAAGFAEVSVDPGTGEVSLLAYGSCSDMGRVLNPTTMEGQEHGAVTQGIGHSLFEELVWDEGQLVTDSIATYRVPRSTDVPSRFMTDAVENGDGPGPFGSKGGGEGPILPVAGAIANAVESATGVRFFGLPLRPERVWRALVDAGMAPDYSGSAGGPRSQQESNG